MKLDIENPPTLFCSDFVFFSKRILVQNFDWNCTELKDHFEENEYFASTESSNI